MNFRTFLAGLALLLSTSFATAQEKVVVATCTSGEGCDCLLSDVTIEEARILLGEGPPPGVEPLLVQTSDGFVWSHVTASDLDLVLGGNGECELALFPAIEPKDGLWRGTVASQNVSGCPAGLESRLVPPLGGVNETRRMEWGGVFRPDLISHPGDTPIQWTKITEDRYRGTMPMPATDQVRLSAEWISEIKDPEYVRSDLDVAIASAASGAAMIGLANCKIHVVVEFRRIGD